MDNSNEEITIVQGELPVLSENVRKPDILQQFYTAVMEHLANHPDVCLRSTTADTVSMRVNSGWQEYTPARQLSFWKDLMRVYPSIGDCKWSTRRLQALWDFFRTYAPDITFDNKLYFEMPSAILDGRTGKLITTPDRHLTHPTLRNSPFDYDPTYEPSQAWQMWYTSMDEHQQAVRAWSVGSAVLGQYGLLFTFGNSRTGKSTLAEGITSVLGRGVTTFNLSQHWGRFYTQDFDNTTYLYDPDSKGSKQKNNENYETLHMMASGDPIRMELKGGASYKSANYGFLEVISNQPVPVYFEKSLIDRVRFCLYTYIEPRGDGGEMKRAILADRQAWVNYAISCAIDLAKNKATRPPIDDYQMYGWVQWLKKTSTYGQMCVDAGRALTYQEYTYAYEGKSRYMLEKSTVSEMRDGFYELERQYGTTFFDKDWDNYEQQLKEAYYDEQEARKLL